MYSAVRFKLYEFLTLKEYTLLIMKLLSCRKALPLVFFSFVAISCNKTVDLSNKTAVTVNCTKSENSVAKQMGSDISLTSQQDGSVKRQFTLLPASVVFEDLQPGTYVIKGESSNSNETRTVTLSKDEEQSVQLSFSE